MRETAIRRVLIFALCVSGIVALWIVSDRSMSSSKVSTTPGAQQPGASPSAGGSPRPATSAAFASSSADGADTGPAQVPPGSPVDPEPDRQGPGTVNNLYLIDSSMHALTVGWSEPEHGSEVAYYEVTLNGIGVGETGGLQLTINWFNDNNSHQFVQVRAVDEAGHRGERGRPLMVNRPLSPAPESPHSHRPQTPPASSPAPNRPDQSRPGSADPGQNRPDQNKPDQNRPDQNRPDQNRPDQSPDPTTPPPSVTARPDPTPRPTPTPDPTTPPESAPTPTPDRTPTPPPASLEPSEPPRDPTPPPPTSPGPSTPPESPAPTEPPESDAPTIKQTPPSDAPKTPRSSPGSSEPELPSGAPRPTS